MPRRKRAETPADATPTTGGATLITSEPTAIATAEPPVDREAAATIADDIRQTQREAVEPTDAPTKTWGNPYNSIYSNPAAGVELGEDRRFKQRVLTFCERPDADTLATLKERGFTYRAAEKAWTVPATPEMRTFTDRFVIDFVKERTGASAAAGRDR